MQSIEGLCKNCLAWNPLPNEPVAVIGQPKRGACTMFPPIPVPAFDQNSRPIGLRNIRPVTSESDFCLHFVVRQDAAPEAPGALNDSH